MSKRKWLANNLDVAICVVVGVGLAAIAITSAIAIVLSLITDGVWHGDIAWLGAKMAFWALFNFSAAHLLHENRTLKADKKRLAAALRFQLGGAA